MAMDKNIDISVLLDVYGKFLPRVQRESLEFYYNDDLSLGEIADNSGKTRQSVFDTIKRGETALFELESKLNFLKKTENLKQQIEKIKSGVLKIKSENAIAKKSEKIDESIDCILKILKNIKL